MFGEVRPSPGAGRARAGAEADAAVIDPPPSRVRPEELELEEGDDRDDDEQDVRDRRGEALVEEGEALLVHVHRDRERLVERPAGGHYERLLEELEVADRRYHRHEPVSYTHLRAHETRHD